jgi:hypothetical protein
VVKLGIKPLNTDENILYAIFHQLPVACNLYPVSVERINEF